MRGLRIAISHLLGMATLMGSAALAPRVAQAQPAPAPAAPPAAAPPAAPPDLAPPPAVAVEAAPPPPPAGPLEVPPDPPPPPSAGNASSTTRATPPPAPTVFADEAGSASARAALGAEPTAGYHGMFFVRDAEGQFRISPTGMLQTDLYTFFGPQVDGVPTQNGGTGLPTRLFVRRVRLGLHGELLKRWQWMAHFDMASGAITNASGLDEVYAAPPGVEPTDSTARYRSVQGVDGSVALREVWLNYSLCGCLNFLVGQTQPPVSMESRTADWAVPMLNRSLANRGLVAPYGRETGLMLWGDLFDDVLSYELMLAGGDGENRATVDGAFDVMGRVVVRPFPKVKLLKRAHVGLSARHGERDPASVAYDLSTISSTQGFTFFEPAYADSQGRRTHVIPSGGQNLIGGELRLPVGPVELTHEMHYASYGTREAVEGFQLTNTERLGLFRGLGFTTRVTWWALGDTFIPPESGVNQPPKLELKRKVEYKRGLELDAVVSSVLAGYEGAAREGEADPNTPGSGDNATDIQVWQLSAAASYWHTRHVRMQLVYSAYLVPDAGAENLAVTPSQIAARPGDEETLHELGTRLQLFF